MNTCKNVITEFIGYWYTKKKFINFTENKTEQETYRITPGNFSDK